MGYYTRHNLQVENGDWALIEDLRDKSEGAKWAIDNNGDCEESCRWYEHEADMREFSKNNPNTLFTLNGEGEEADDLWVEYYKNGLMQRCKAKVFYDDFDESLMK